MHILVLYPKYFGIAFYSGKEPTVEKVNTPFSSLSKVFLSYFSGKELVEESKFKGIDFSYVCLFRSVHKQLVGRSHFCLCWKKLIM